MSTTPPSEIVSELLAQRAAAAGSVAASAPDSGSVSLKPDPDPSLTAADMEDVVLKSTGGFTR
jgi:hypothetical protein